MDKRPFTNIELLSCFCYKKYYYGFLLFFLDGWVGIVRVCYQRGTLPGLNETDGCRYWTTGDGFTALYCFCTTDYCNAGTRTTQL